ncbi:MAG: phosphate/phosphite/phosphonate ABC transporter substrate-binding protein [Gammaproteobacteria bacterium]
MSKTILILGACSIVFYVAFILFFSQSASIISPPEKQKIFTKNSSHFYTFGVVPQYEQRRIFHIWRPILNELEARTNIKLKMEGTAKIPDFTRKFLQGKFDFAYMNPYHMMQAVDTQGYIPLVRDGGRSLKGIIVVHKDSKFTTIEDLPKLNFAFPSANALGASLLIKAELVKRNILFTPKYVQTHSSVYLHVAKKLYPIGGGVLSTLTSQKQQIKNSLRIIFETPSVSPHPISAHPRVPKEIRLKVKNALLEMSKSKHFQKYLEKIPIKKMIPARIEEYIKLRELHLDKLYIAENID